VGPLTALAFELVIGTPERFACAKQIDRGGYRRKLYLSKSGVSVEKLCLLKKSLS